MRNKNFGYLAKEGVRGIFLHGFMSFAAICVTVACLIIMGTFSLILLNLDEMVSDLEQQNQVLVYLDDSYTEAEAKSVGSEINLIPNVLKSEFVSKDEALSQFVSEQDDPTMFSGLGSDTLRHRFVVTLEDSAQMEKTVQDLENITGVAKVNAHLEIANGFMTVRNVLQIVSTAIIVILLVVSLFIISNTVKLAMYDRKDEIAIMKMVGATNGFIRFPFVIEGSIIGILSAALAFFAEWGLYDLMTAKISQVDTLRLFTAIPFGNVLGIMVAAYVAAGLFVGVFGSLMSIRKFLDV
ncbi:MAG: permease-like cell division protein FtsX [Oscillospiraceae bacterium]|nr:permease-like cell division protein FtsX [Oscillospiraceae bacterium]